MATSDGTVGVTDFNTGNVKTVDTSEITNDEGTVVERQRMAIGDGSSPDLIASVNNTDPSDNDPGLVIRIAAKDHEFGQIHELLFMIANSLEDIKVLLSNGG